MITQELLSFIKQNISQGKSEEEIKRILLTGGGWNESDIDEAIRAIGMSIPRLQALPPKKTKGFGLLLGIEIFLFILLLIGFILGNKVGKISAIEDLIAFAAMIAIIPEIIISIFGVKDGIKGIRNHTKGGIFILIFSILLLVVSFFCAAYLFGGLNSLLGLFRLM